MPTCISFMSAMSRPFASMRRMISPTSLRRTPSPLTSTRVSSKILSLSNDRHAAALVRAAVRAHPPLHVQRLVAVHAGFLELPGARRADQVIPLDQVAAVRAQKDAVPELALEHGQLKLAFAGLFQVLGGAYDQVHQGTDIREEDGHEAPQYAHRSTPRRVRVRPVDERDPQDDEQEDNELARDPQDRALQEVGYDLEGVGVLLQQERRTHRINLIIMK